MRIPFDLQDWLRDKSQKVETRDGRLVHNIWSIKEPCYTNNKKAEVCALIDGEEDALVFFEGGRYLPTTKDTDSPFDLFIVTPEEELTPFEKELVEILKCLSGRPSEQTYEDYAKEQAAELLELAKDEIYSHKSLVEYARVSREQGKAEALKDLPRWKKDKSFETEGTFMGVKGREIFVVKDGYSISVAELIEKLPGFKEDEK